MWMKWLHNRQPGFYIDAFINVRGLAPKVGNEKQGNPPIFRGRQRRCGLCRWSGAIVKTPQSYKREWKLPKIG
jgi:hypothetical protein